MSRSSAPGSFCRRSSDDHHFGDAEPDYRFIVDPVDGSDNWGRGLPLLSVAVAVLPAQGPIALDRVVAAATEELAREITGALARHN